MKTLKLTAIVVLLLSSAASVSGATYSATPSDDIWAYPFGSGSSNPIRVWGNGTSATGALYPPMHDFSYGYFKWDIGYVGAGNYLITSATLTVTHIANPGYTLSEGQAKPIEARPVGSGFAEGSWNYYNPANPSPAASVYGTGSLGNYVATGSTFTIAFDLLNNPGLFESAFNVAANGDGKLAIALTSVLSPSGMGSTTFYSIYSRENAPDLRPTLSIEYSIVPEPSVLIALAGGLTTLAGAMLRQRAL